MNIEKALRQYLKGTGPKVRESEFYDCTFGDGNATINVLFRLVNEEIDSITEQHALDRVVEVLKLMETTLSIDDGVNRKIVSRKLLKLDEKMDRILAEGGKKFSNLNKIASEFNKVRRQLERLSLLNEAKDTRQYDFMKFLIQETKNIAYLEFAFKKMPSLVNVKDKDDIPLFRNLIRNYLNSVLLNDEENILYYESLMALLSSQKSFELSVSEKRNCLEEIYCFLDKLRVNKRQEKKNKEKIERIEYLVSFIKNEDAKREDISSLASKYKIHVVFDEAIIEEARLAKVPMEGEIGDRCVVDDFIISMDGDDAKEIDDALSCKRLPNGHYLLGVHIASVLGYFPYDSSIVEEAISRNQSIYLPYRYQAKDDDFNRTIPIFPYIFSANKGSLLEGERRLARSYFFEIDENGDVVSRKFVKSIIKNRKQLTYDEVNSLICSGGDGEVFDVIQNLVEVTSLLDKKHQVNELYERVKESSFDYSELRVRKVGSENIVYQAMILTGSEVANFFASKNLPFLYRTHEVNEENNRKLESMISTLNRVYVGQQFKNLYQLIDGIYPKGRYAMEGKHDGLLLDHYCHCTSLLRRAADIVVEHALEVCYDREASSEEIDELREDILSKMVSINSRQAPIEYFVKEYQKVYRR